MDELAWVEFLKKKASKSSDVLVGIGDDCAVVKGPASGKLLLKSDLFIQDVHFKLGKTSLEDVGKRAVGRVLSDFAAMAGHPRFIGVSAGIPKKIPLQSLKKILAGILEMGKRYKFSLIGGDTGKADKLFLDIWGVGSAEKYILRSGAKYGDFIFITSKLGQRPFNQPFEPRLDEAAWLVKNFRVNSMLDISDGFIIDLYRILRASKRGALINGSAVPVTAGRSDFYRGEDYELIFTVDKSEPRLKLIENRFYRVGRIVEKDFGLKIQDKGRLRPAIIKGYRHF
jgi:thiamine-monophosphate kinase